MNLLLLHFTSAINSDLSYQHGWVRAFRSDPRVCVTDVNLAQPYREWNLLRTLSAARFDLCVVLHSAFSNSRYLRLPGQLMVAASRIPTVYFIGNEYKSMREKMRFADMLRIRLLVTMSFNEQVVELYRKRLGCEVMSLPSGGLDADLFPRGGPISERPIDIGFRGYDEPVYFGHQERRDLRDRTESVARELHLRCDLSMEAKDRLVGEDWARFLQSCKSTIGTYSGFDHFDLDDTVRSKVMSFLRDRPDADFDAVYKSVFVGQPKLYQMRLITGRHVEAAASGTVQVLLRGDYSGYFQEGVHFIPVDLDYSNLREAIEASQDPSVAQPIADRAYEVVTSELTYEALLDRFFARVASIL